jgi:hypothetical protein
MMASCDRRWQRGRVERRPERAAMVLLCCLLGLASTAEGGPTDPKPIPPAPVPAPPGRPIPPSPVPPPQPEPIPPAPIR